MNKSLQELKEAIGEFESYTLEQCEQQADRTDENVLLDRRWITETYDTMIRSFFEVFNYIQELERNAQ